VTATTFVERLELGELTYPTTRKNELRQRSRDANTFSVIAELGNSFFACLVKIGPAQAEVAELRLLFENELHVEGSRRDLLRCSSAGRHRSHIFRPLVVRTRMPRVIHKNLTWTPNCFDRRQIVPLTESCYAQFARVHSILVGRLHASRLTVRPERSPR